MLILLDYQKLILKDSEDSKMGWKIKNRRLTWKFRNRKNNVQIKLHKPTGIYRIC